MIASLIQKPYTCYTHAKNEVKKLWSENAIERNESRQSACMLASRVSLATLFLFAQILVDKLPPELRLVSRVLTCFPLAIISTPSLMLGIGVESCCSSVRFVALIPTCLKAERKDLATICGLFAGLGVLLAWWAKCQYQSPENREMENKVGVVPKMADFLFRQWKRLDIALGY